MDADPPAIIAPAPAGVPWVKIDDHPTWPKWLLRDRDGKPLMVTYGEQPRPATDLDLARFRALRKMATKS